MLVVQIATYPRYFHVLLSQKKVQSSLLKVVRWALFGTIATSVRTTAVEFYNGEWMLHSGLSMTWASRNLWPRRVVRGIEDD